MVDVVGVGPEQTVGRPGDLDVVGAGKQRVEWARGGVDRQDPVVSSVKDQDSDVVSSDLGDIGAEVGRPA